MDIENSSTAVTADTMNPEVERLLMENSKLKYQISHLKRVCAVSVSVVSAVFNTKNIDINIIIFSDTVSWHAGTRKRIKHENMAQSVPKL